MKVTIITPAHNEENNIKRCVIGVRNLNVPNDFRLEHVVVLDRCTDSTEKICKSYGAGTLRKDFRGEFVDPIGEVVDFGVKNTDGEYIGIVDADIELPRNFLTRLLPHLDSATICVSCSITTRTGKKWLDFFMYLRDLNYKITPLGKEPRGGARIMNRKLLEKIGGFDRDKPSWDTAIDLEARKHGYKCKVVDDVVAIEFRKLTLKDIVHHQISAGKARRKLGISLLRTLLHSIFRFRPFVIVGWLLVD